jgi:hypothetical protein
MKDIWRYRFREINFSNLSSKGWVKLFDLEVFETYFCHVRFPVEDLGRQDIFIENVDIRGRAGTMICRNSPMIITKDGEELRGTRRGGLVGPGIPPTMSSLEWQILVD